MKGEAALRNSGLGYTIIRPGKLIEEPGGYRALVFDQGDRSLNTVSCADVADVCVKVLNSHACVFQCHHSHGPAGWLCENFKHNRFLLLSWILVRCMCEPLRVLKEATNWRCIALFICDE